MINKYILLSLRFEIIVVVILSSLLSFLAILLILSSSSYAQLTELSSTISCITYDPGEKTITITCKSANLTDIDNQLKDPNILHKETGVHNDGYVWLLNAGIEVAPNAILYINSTDTSWLKVLAADGQTAHLILYLDN